ncbi:MAG: DUF4352 domain-containing protein [Thermomicrobiales bacterium]
MHRILMIVALLGVFVVGSVASVTAQDATPEAPQAGPAGDAAGGGDPAVGEAAIYINEQGEEAAQVTIEEVIDPFEDYDEGDGPDRGYRFVALRITVEATGEDAVDVSAFDFLLQDSQGFLWNDTLVFRAEEQEEADPEMEDANLAPGDSVSGLLFYTLYADNDVDHIFWQPESGRLITVAKVS